MRIWARKDEELRTYTLDDVCQPKIGVREVLADEPFAVRGFVCSKDGFEVLEVFRDAVFAEVLRFLERGIFLVFVVEAGCDGVVGVVGFVL